MLTACLPSLRPLLNLALHGSVDASNRTPASSRRESGKKLSKFYGSWPSSITSRNTISGKGASIQVEDDGMDGFVRLADSTQVHRLVTRIGPSDPKLIEPTNGIQVRTEVSVINQV